MRCVLISMWFVRCKLCRVHCPTLTSTHYHRWTPLFSHWETPWNTAWQQQKKDWPPFQSSKEIKIFSRFRLVKTTRIIYHNQLLFTKFGRIFAISWLNQWRHKCSPPKIIEPMTSKRRQSAARYRLLNPWPGDTVVWHLVSGKQRA